MRFLSSTRQKAWQGFSFPYRVVLVVLCATAGLCWGQSQPSQRPQSGSTSLMSVEVNGSTRFASAKIAEAVGLHPGDSVTREDIQGAADRLIKLGLFASVQYRFSSLGPGVRLDYQVVDAAEVPIAFDNMPWFTDEELISALKASVPLFNGLAPLSGALLDNISTGIEKLVDARGIHTRVSHSLSVAGASANQVQLFRVENGGLDVASIEFSDALANSDRGVQDLAADLVGKPFSRTAIEIFELEQVRPLYLEHGFLRVQFDQPNARLADQEKNAPSKKVTVVAPIQPGPAYTWNGLTWRGDYAMPPDVLDELVKLKTGELANGMKINAALESVREGYSEHGFLDAKFEATAKFDEDTKRVSYAVSIDEGPQYHMGNLVLTGLSVEGEKRIRGAWNIATGSVFDKIAYDQFVDTGIKKAFAGQPFRYEKIGRFLQENAQDSKVDVMLDFQ